MKDLAAVTSGTPDLAAGLRHFREQAGLAQQALGSRANVATRTIARIEQGEDVRLGTVVRLAEALGVTAVDLISTHKHAAAIGEHAIDGHVVVDGNELTTVVTGHAS